MVATTGRYSQVLYFFLFELSLIFCCTETKIKKLHQLQFPPEQQTIVLKILNDEIEALKKASIETLKQDRLLTNRLSLLSTGGMDKQPDSNQ